MTHLALVGPTASGKSDLALALAQTLGDVEIVSVDSMQVYRGLDIGTAKPSASERSEISHHLVDVVDPWTDYTVVQFQSDARAAVADIEARGLRALLVGGTGLYVQAVIDDLRFPGEDLKRRADLEARAEDATGVAAMYRELQQCDPVAAARIEPGNVRRIVRALEVIKLTGEPFSSFGPGIATFDDTVFPVDLVGLWVPRDVLGQRIAARTEQMRSAGLVAEVQALLAGGGLSRNAAQAIGYKEVMDGLEQGGGRLDGRLDELFESIARRTQQLARRQRMWFRRDPRITWLGSADNPCDLLPTLLAMWKR